jgi:hypothetical protein
VGIVIARPGLFTDKSRTLRNMTVAAWQGDRLVEEHNCTYVETAGREEYFMETVFICHNETRFHFRKLEVSKEYSFTIEACNSAGCVHHQQLHSTQNW